MNNYLLITLLFPISLCHMACAMWKVTATLPQENGSAQVVEFDIDSRIAVQEIAHAFQIPYSEQLLITFVLLKMRIEMFVEN